MKAQYFPILLVILANTCYHLFQKSTPMTANPIAALMVTYFVAFVVSTVSFFIFAPDTNLIESLRDTNWASILLGFAVVGLEMGFLIVYRLGWNISVAGLLSNTVVALLLIPIGVLFYKEKVSTTTISGVVLCIIGLILITKK